LFPAIVLTIVVYIAVLFWLL